MYAIIETGGKQYRVAEDQVITIERLTVERGDRVEFERVLAVGDGDDVIVGTPCVPEAKVVARVVQHGRGTKIHGFKYKKQKRYRRQWGHRQNNTQVLIEKIAAGPADPAKTDAEEE